MSSYILIGDAEIPPSDDHVLCSNGIWHKKIYITEDGSQSDSPTNTWTIKIPHEGQTWNFDKEEWEYVIDFIEVAEERTGEKILEYEMQYKDGILTKANHTPASPIYPYINQRFKILMGDDYFTPGALSEDNKGKLSSYQTFNKDKVREILDKFGVPEGNWNETFSLSILPTGEKTLKLYDRDIEKYSIPVLPEGVTLKEPATDSKGVYGVARVWMNGNFLPFYEVYFTGERESVEAWAAELGLKTPDSIVNVDYWGIVFDDDLNISCLKALMWRHETVGEVELCWVDGRLHRSGYHPFSEQGIEVLKKVPVSWRPPFTTTTEISDRILGEYGRQGSVMNTGSNIYDMGEWGEHEIISVYSAGRITEEMRKEFGVPDDVKPPAWIGRKYCPHYDCVWLKLIDMDYSKYNLPSIPKNAIRAFGVATVYPGRKDQPPVHNAPSAGFRDCSFITHDHKSVRDWCFENGVPDPRPDLPDELTMIGVYSITHHQETLEIQRVKFYDYHNQQLFDMESYLRAVLAGREAGLEWDEPLYTEQVLIEAHNKVETFRELKAKEKLKN